MGACLSTDSMLMWMFLRLLLPGESKPSCKKDQHSGVPSAWRGGYVTQKGRPSLEPFETTHSKCEGTFDTAIRSCLRFGAD